MVSRMIQVGLVSVILAAAGAASAQQTTYDYTGAPMSGTVFYDIAPPSCNCGTGPETLPYSASFDGTMTLSSPLAPDLNNAIVDPTALTLSITGLAGPFGGSQQAFSMVVYATDLSNTSSWLETNAPISVSTNSAGQITAWSAQVGSVNPADPGNIWTANLSSSTGDNLNFYYINHGPFYKLSNSTPGSWAAVASRSVPEIDPSGAGAALTLLGGLIAVLRGRRRLI